MNRTCHWLLIVLLGAGSAPLYADVVNGNKIYIGAPSARFPTGSHACNACHDGSNSDRLRGGAGNPGAIDAAFNSTNAANKEMKSLYGPGGTYPMSPADEQDLADYIGTIYDVSSTGPTFSLTPMSAAFATLAVGAQSAAVEFTVSVADKYGVVSAASLSDTANFAVLGGTCMPMPRALAQDTSCTLQVVFAPETMGAHAATLTIADNGTPAVLTAALGGAGTASGGAKTISAVEFYNATFNHYFITPNAIEIGLLGHPPFSDWQPTGLQFNVYPQTDPVAGSVGVCRFFNDHFAGISTHFYAPHGLGCEATISGFPDWTLEDPQLFYAMLPDTAGNCPAGNIPVYRLYNNGMGGAPNHRFTIDATVRQQMIDKGYTPEGYGIGVGWCAPQ